MVGISGNILTTCIFLSCAAGGLVATYADDFKIENNQFGILAGGAHPTFGCYLNNCGAGTYLSNFHWNNVIGHKSLDCNYNRMSLNRFEQSDNQNVWMEGCDFIEFCINDIHTGSQSASGTYPAVYWKTCARCVIANNQVFSFDSSQVSYGMYFDTGNSTLTIKANQITSYALLPYFLDPSIVSNPMNYDETLRLYSGVTVAANSTVYIGPGGAANASVGPVEVVSGHDYQVAAIYIASDSAPGGSTTIVGELFVNSAATTPVMSATITGSAFDAYGTATAPVLADATTICMQVAAGGIASSSHIRALIELLEF